MENKMELTITVIDIEGWGYGYTIESADGSVRIRQETKPDVPGNVKMTRETATQLAQEHAASLTPAV